MKTTYRVLCNYYPIITSLRTNDRIGLKNCNFFGFIGAAVYFIAYSTGFWMDEPGFLKAICFL